jgi:hypothetical protein
MAHPPITPAPRTRRILLAVLAVVLVLAGAVSLHLAASSARAGRSRATAPPVAPSGPDTVHIEVEHTLFHPMDNVVLQVERLNGRLVATTGQTISLDDKNSFSVQIDQAVTRLSARDLSALINSYLLRQAGSAIRQVDVSFDGQQVVVKGKVHKLLTLPFEGRGTLSTTPDGELRMHMDEFRVAGMLNRKFLAMLGIRLDDVAQPRRKPSFRVEGDDFLTSLNELFPPPRVYGRLTRVHVEQQDLVQVIGVEPPEHAIAKIPKALPEPPNYVYFTGGRMRFGRVTMDNVDLKMVDSTPENPFDFSLDHYQQQIEAGYVKVLPNQGLEVYAGDWNTLAAHKNAPQKK